MRDHTVAETATATKLSANSINAIFQKIRVYLSEVHFYWPLLAYKFESEKDDPDAYHNFIMQFHRERIALKRGLKPSDEKSDYHILESFWRFDYHLLVSQRRTHAEEVYGMMLRDLIALIRICGPIGSKPGKIWHGRSLLLKQHRKRALWLVRNGPDFQEDKHLLMEILEEWPD